jgi:hypothetical protein
MPQVGFEFTIPAFEQVKTVHGLDCAATMIGSHGNLNCQNFPSELLYASLFIFLRATCAA